MAAPTFRLSVLDQSPIPEGFTAGDALRNSLDLARLADRSGFHRYWVAEHHGSPALACASPEVLIGPIAGATRNLRVGSGGVMLPHYSPLKVAENFSMLSGLYPGRIDLAIGRAAGTSPNVSRALQRDRRQMPPDDFPDQFAELQSYFANARPLDEPFPRLPATFPVFAAPEVWLLGSSAQSAVWAAEWGLPYCFADFINSDGAALARHYRQHFRPSATLARPQVAVAAWAVCAADHETAADLALSMRMMMRLLQRGRLMAVPTVEHARLFLASDGSVPDMLPARRIITGRPQTVRRDLENLAQDYEADEVFVVNILHSHEARMNSYRLLAEEFNLTPKTTAAAPAYQSA